MRRIFLAAAAAALAFVALAAPASAGGCINETRPTEGTSPAVRIDQCQFLSAVLRIRAGTSVTWTNADHLPHEISGVGWGRTQSMLMPGESFSHDFTEDGIYPYFCPLHPGMAAVVLVGDVAAPGAQPDTIATKIDTAPRGPAERSAGGASLAIALLVSTLVGVTSFTAGRYLGR